MEPVSSRRTTSGFRSQLTWKKVGLWAAVPPALVFLILNWNGCWFYRHEPKDFVLFIYIFIWLVAFFALAVIWRMLLVAGTLIVLVPFVGVRGIAEMNAAPESAAVHALHALNFSLQAQNNAQAYSVFPEKLPAVELPPIARKFYRFEYVPNRSADGGIRSYLIEAVPSRRGCDLERSFTITSDNRVFWTMESRPAVPSDNLLEE
jgi:hypothetical protein